MKFVVLFIVLFLPCRILKSQSADIESERMENIFETILSMQDDDAGIGEFQDELTYLFNNPVNINRAEREDLNIFFFISRSQADSLISYRQKHGGFLSAEEINFVEGFNPEIAALLIPFITTDPVPDKKHMGLKSWIREGDKVLLARYSRQLEKPAGYDPSLTKSGLYLGNPDQYLMRFRLSVPSEMSAGITAEKDNGEPLIWSPSMNYFGPDHYTCHFAVFNLGILKSLVIGDYKVSFGQGLIMGNSFYLGKSTEAIASIMNKTSGIRPYSGSGESGFFRGVAAEFRLGKLTAGGYVSAKKPDSRIEDLDPGDERDEVIRGFITTGLHRTAGEIKNRKNTMELAAGYHAGLSNKNQNFSLGASSVFIHFNRVYLELPAYYNQYDFTGKEYFASSLDYNYYHRKFNIFGELAYSGKGEVALVNGIIANLSKNIETSLHVRYFSRGFHSFYGNPFRESGSLGGESGIYWGIKFMPVRNLTLTYYFDTYRFPWLRYNLKGPTSGSDLFARILFNPARDFEVYGQFLSEMKDASLPDNRGGINQILPGIKNRYWLQASWTPHRWQIRSRVQYSTYRFNGTGTAGTASFLDVGYTIHNCSIHCRVTWFKTEDYINRQYIYEQGALYDFQVPSFYGQGMRLYLLANLKISRNFHCWIKGGRTWYDNTETIGTGPEKLNVNHRTEMMIQGEYKF